MAKVNTGLLFADILIVDGTPAFTAAVRPALQAAGYIVRREEESERALRAIRTNPPDIVLLEATLPDIDGYEVARRIKSDESLPFVPIVIMKAQHTREDAAAAMDAGADEFIAKPVDTAELLTRVRAMLRLKATTDELAELTDTLELKVEERTRQLEEAQARLRHAEKLSALGRLSASVAHEVNNPLTAILGHLYLINQNLEAGSPLSEDLGVIEREVNAISKLVQQLRDFSKPPARDRELVSLNAVVEEVLDLVGKQLSRHRVETIVELEPDLAHVSASPDQMREVLLNLILNAQDAMPDGGTLAIHTSSALGIVMVKVIDTGTGISPDVIDYIFEPFFTTKGKKGTGLGLAICHSIAHDHDGDIFVTSEVGKGTTFTLQLPAGET